MTIILALVVVAVGDVDDHVNDSDENHDFYQLLLSTSIGDEAKDQ